MDYSLPGSSVHGISQARILGWVSVIVRRILYTEPPGKSGKQIATGPAVGGGGHNGKNRASSLWGDL